MDDINLLPSEMRSKNPKKKKKEKAEVEMSSSVEEGFAKEKKEKNKAEGGVLGSFSFIKKIGSGKNESTENKLDMLKERESLLREIKYKNKSESEKGGKEEERKLKQPSSPIKAVSPHLSFKGGNKDKSREKSSWWDNFLARRREKKKKKKEEKARIKDAKKIFSKAQAQKKKDLQPLISKENKVENKNKEKQGASQAMIESMPVEELKKDETLNSKKEKAEKKEVKPASGGKEPAIEKIKEKQKEGAAKGDILETNLIKEQKLIFTDWRKHRRHLSMAIVFSLFVVAALYGWLSWEEARLRNMGLITPGEKELAEKKQQLASLKEEAEKLSSLREKAKKAKKILDNHVYWTNFFNYLEENTIAEVYYEEFSGDLSGKYSLTGNTEDFEFFIKQVDAWQKENKYTEKATVKGGETKSRVSDTQGKRSGTVVNFEIDLKVDKEIFYPN